MRLGIAAFGLSLLGAVGCSDLPVQGASGDLSFAPVGVDFGSVFRTQPLHQTVELRNSGRVDLPVTWTLPGAPFFADSLPSVAPAGSVTVALTFESPDAGTFTDWLQVSSTTGSARAVLSAIAEEFLPCPTPIACHTETFDPALGTCVDASVVDGTLCDVDNACIADAACRAGRCVGNPVSCDDHDACTTDSCDPVAGCQHVAVACPGDGVCQVGVCNPSSGCGLAPASDGTVCGSRDCAQAQVCIAGSCVTRVAPDGFVCALASPCQPAGVCQSNQCVQAPATPLAQTWSLDSEAPDGGGGNALNDFVMLPTGEVSLLEYFGPPPLISANEASPVEAQSNARRCILWDGALACADYSAQGVVGLLSLQSGMPQWTFDLVTARPDFAAMTATNRLFMARLASLGSDHLAALFEGYPAGSMDTTLCRLYFLVLLDTQGNMVEAEQVQDPLLEACDHPHPFGVVSDETGRLFLGFSPTASGGAPLVPAMPTLLVAFAHDGTLLWKQTFPFLGGELAAGDGWVFPEGSNFAFDEATGQPTVLGSGGASALGRVVATADRMSTAPLAGGSALYGYRASDLQLVWSFGLSAGDSFLTDEVHLAQLPAQPTQPAQSALLAFASLGGQSSLLAVDPESGAQLWSCPLGYTSANPPQLFEVTNDSLGLMEGATTCGHCDPPFAITQSSLFRTLSVPGITPSQAPWTGLFGGAGHPHHGN